jgi:prepilin-type N-terminal cleavage/methylation domain-containing protein
MPRHTEGFSLIEAAVAIAIMAILAGAALPMLMKAVNQQREQTTRDNLKIAYEAMFGARDRRLPNMVADCGYVPGAWADLRDMAARPAGTAAWQAGPNFYWGWNGPYWNGSVRTIGGVTLPADGWGHPILLQAAGSRWQMVSAGADGDPLTAQDNLVYPSQAVDLSAAYLAITLQNNRGAATSGTVVITDRSGGTVLRLQNGAALAWSLGQGGSAQVPATGVLTVSPGPVTITVNIASAPAATLVEVVDLLPGQTFAHTYAIY